MIITKNFLKKLILTMSVMTMSHMQLSSLMMPIQFAKDSANLRPRKELKESQQLTLLGKFWRTKKCTIKEMWKEEHTEKN